MFWVSELDYVDQANTIHMSKMDEWGRDKTIRESVSWR